MNKMNIQSCRMNGTKFTKVNGKIYIDGKEIKNGEIKHSSFIIRYFIFFIFGALFGFITGVYCL